MKTTILGLVLAAALTVPALGREIVVDLNGGGDFTEIQPAIDAAEDGDTVLVRSGEYVITESIDFNPLHDPEDPGSNACTLTPTKNTWPHGAYQEGLTMNRWSPVSKKFRCISGR